MKVIVIVCLWTSLLYAETQVYRAEAKNEGKLVYRETHLMTIENGKVQRSITEYKDPSGKLIGILENDFTQGLAAPAHTMKDFRAHNQHGIRYVDGKIQLFNQDDGKEEETKTLDPKDFDRLIMSSLGLHFYFQSHFDEIIQKGELKMSYLIPVKLTDFDFDLKVVDKTPQKITLEVSISNWFLRLFAPKLKLVYDRETKRIISYQGLSNLKSDKGSMMGVDIDYDYSH